MLILGRKIEKKITIDIYLRIFCHKKIYLHPKNVQEYIFLIIFFTLKFLEIFYSKNVDKYSYEK